MNALSGPEPGLFFGKAKKRFEALAPSQHWSSVGGKRGIRENESAAVRPVGTALDPRVLEQVRVYCARWGGGPTPIRPADQEVPRLGDPVLACD